MPRRSQLLFVSALALFCCGWRELAVAADGAPETSNTVLPAVIEPWADQRNPATAGLAVWFDASRQFVGRERLQLPPLAVGGPMTIWLDGSGHGRHALSRSGDEQPSYVPIGGGAVARFDGENDYLSATGGRQSLDDFTLLIVAAPRSNPGYFRGLFAANQLGRNDYTSGFCVDLSGIGSQQFDTLNVEGAGFGGAVDLLDAASPFGSWHTLEITGTAAKEGVRLWLDGAPQQNRDRAASKLSINEITVGARFFSNSEQPAKVTSFFHGDVAEILLYDRLLADEERAAVRKYLADKWSEAAKLASGADGRRLHILEPVRNPPHVQMLVPGFAVRELPLSLTNLNNVKYRDDGKLVALAYNGNVYLLADTDGDGLEDQATPFWDRGGLRGPIGLALTPPGYPLGRGVFVPSKGKVSLLLDRDGDDRADEEIIVAQGWAEIAQSVDAVGVALDRQGNLFFGLGTPNFANPYLLDEQGVAHFDLDGQNGTVQQVSPDWKRRETYAKGTRFPVAMAFNRHGDLFCTDQEGATWMPNGNPFDELLHLQPNRYYGFPPRHPRHLPRVIDEPSTFEYRPQHQSTCGLNFNESVNGGPVFGPAWWTADALVCGESRGKLYRTKLAKTVDGYVATGALVGCLDMLTVDACVSPHGELVVCCHSGPPDWGTGPTGIGKLFKIAYADREHPQPVVAWAASPHEVRVQFDRPVSPELLRNLSQTALITYGSFVAAGDDFESFRPGYEVVQRQMGAARMALPVRSATLTADRTTIVLATDEHPEAVNYALRLPGMGRPQLAASAAAEIAQHPVIDLAYDLSGVEAEWLPVAASLGQVGAGGGSATVGGAVAAEAPSWRGWLPTVQLAASRELLAGSPAHAELWRLLETPGTMKLRTQIQIANMLRPAVQPGSKVDLAFEPEQVTLEISLSGDGVIRSPLLPGGGQRRQATIALPPGAAEPVPLEIELSTSDRLADVRLAFYTGDDDRRRIVAPHRLLLPWAKLKAAEALSGPRPAPPELAGGDSRRGREVFLSNDALCFKCHLVRGQGGRIGPDLSNLVHRDYASVLRDVTYPSYAINPDYISYHAQLKDGRQLSGTLRSEDGRLHIGDKEGRESIVDSVEVEALTPQAGSIMPDDLPKKLGPERMRDLLTYLLMGESAELQPASITRTDAPPPRTRAETTKLLAALPASPPSQLQRPLKVLLVYGEKDHGINEHDYPQWRERWTTLLGLDAHVEVTSVLDWPTPADFAAADVMLWYSANLKWTDRKAPDLDAFLARGGGLVFLHYAVNGTQWPEALAERIGLAARIGRTAYRHGPLDVDFRTSRPHPITAGFTTVHFEDESYWKMIGDPAKCRVLGVCDEEGQTWPLFWTHERGRGKVFCSIVGHYSWTFDDPFFRTLVLRGAAWAAGEPLDRFHPLVLVGARLDGD